MSRTFPVITKLMISFDLWRLREAFGLTVLNAVILAVEMQQHCSKLRVKALRGITFKDYYISF